MGRLQPAGACLSRTASSRSQSSDMNISAPPWPPGLVLAKPSDGCIFLSPMIKPSADSCTINKNSLNLINLNATPQSNNLDLHLSTTTTTTSRSSKKDLREEDHSTTQLQLSIGSSDDNNNNNDKNNNNIKTLTEDVNVNAAASRLREEAREQLRVAMNERAFAEDARKQAKALILMAEQEFANAKRIRQQAIAELERAQAINDHSVRRISSTIFQITCNTCKQLFPAPAADNSLVFGYVVAGGREVDLLDDRRRLATNNT